MKPFGLSLSLLLFASFAFAGLYDPVPLAGLPAASPFLPNEKCPFQIQEGKAVPLEFGTRNDGEFAARFAVHTNLLDANPKRLSNPDRTAVLDAIRYRLSLRDIRGPLVEATLAASFIRTGQPDKAITLLQPHSRGRSATFTVLTNLAHAHAAKGDWESALRTHEVATEYEAKDDLKAMTAEQVKWLTTVEKKYYRTWLSWNLKNPKPKPDTDEPPSIFGSVKWVNDAGQYEPGHLAAGERAKLPPDAIAVVQQLLLWQPTDTGLYWLLAELYAVEGKLRQAAVILDQCAWSWQYSNRKVMMAHREAIKSAVDKLPPEKAAEELVIPQMDAAPSLPGDDGLPPLRNVLIGLAILTPVVLILLAFQIRAFARKWKSARRRHNSSE